MADLDLDLAIANIDPETGEIKATAYFEDYLHGISNPQLGDASYIKLSDVKSSGTGGGTSSVGNNIRTLNTKDFDAGNNCTLAVNELEFTLLTGTYRINASAPGYRSDGHTLSLYNITDSQIEPKCIGTAEHSPDTNYPQTRSFINSQFTITDSKTFRFDHYFEVVHTNIGLGVPNSTGNSDIYTVVELWKIS